MTLHLVKLCVGAGAIAELADWQRRRVEGLRAAGQEPVLYHRTRQTPRRDDALLDGGSIYWVVKGAVLVRQRLIGFRPAVGEDGIARCDLLLDPVLVATRPQPRRAFQGWRYLEPADAPPDLSAANGGTGEVPEAMRAELMELGLL